MSAAAMPIDVHKSSGNASSARTPRLIADALLILEERLRKNLKMVFATNDADSVVSGNFSQIII